MQKFPPECKEFFIAIKVLKILPGMECTVFIFNFCVSSTYLFLSILFYF